MIKRLFVLALSILLLSACSSEKPFNKDELSPLLPPDDPTPSIVADNVVEGEPPPSIFVDGELYIFFDTAKGSRHNIDELEYLGGVVAVTSYETDDSLIPKENFYSSSFPVGTEIYRIDEESLYIEYTLYDGVTGKSMGLYSAFGYIDE